MAERFTLKDSQRALERLAALTGVPLYQARHGDEPERGGLVLDQVPMSTHCRIEWRGPSPTDHPIVSPFSHRAWAPRELVAAVTFVADTLATAARYQGQSFEYYWRMPYTVRGHIPGSPKGELGFYTCDKCGETPARVGPVLRLATDANDESGVHLCRPCWGAEMAWRRERNRTLAPEARFPIRPFPVKGGR